MTRVRKVEPEAVRVLCDDLLLDEDLESTWEPDGEYWGVFEGPDIVGFGGYKQSQRFSDAVFFHCSGVAERARGRHLQRRLIRARLRGAKKAGYNWAVTYTLCNNPASARSLIACGFKPYWPRNPWAGVACYWYRRL